MWKNERRSALIRNIIIFLLLAAAVAGLLVAMKQAREQIAAEDALLKSEHSSQRQEQNEARKENLESIQQAYEKDLKTVAQYLPGIICWGDSLTAGSSGNVSYPATLQKYINTYLCDIYDLRSSIEDAELYTRLNWDDYKISIPVINMGSGKEDTATILGRSGVVPYVVKSDFVIPSDTTSVPITIKSENGSAVTPLTAGNAGVNPVRIAGVQGTLSLVTTGQGWGQYTYEFSRLEEGAETTVPSGTEIVTSCKEEYRDYIHIIWLGTYGDFQNPEKLVSDVKTLLQRQIGNPDRYLVIGPCALRGTWAGTDPSTLDAIDSTMLQAFGSHYLNVRKYLMVDGLRDAGIPISKEDKLIIQRGRVPESFRSNTSDADLNSIAYKLIGKLVYERMDRLGYFDELRSGLNLDKITQDLLKKDPAYFEKLLNTD